MDDEDPNLGRPRDQVDQALEDLAPTRGVDEVGLVTASAAGLAVLSLLIGLAIIAPL